MSFVDVRFARIITQISAEINFPVGSVFDTSFETQKTASRRRSGFFCGSG
jgi:hypothetical protein